MKGRGGKLTRQITITIRIITSEECVPLIARDDLLVPAYDLPRGGLAKVLLVVLRRIAVAKDVLLRVLGQRHRVLEPFSQLDHLRLVAGEVDLEFVHCTFVPCSGAWFMLGGVWVRGMG